MLGRIWNSRRGNSLYCCIYSIHSIAGLSWLRPPPVATCRRPKHHQLSLSGSNLDSTLQRPQQPGQPQQWERRQKKRKGRKATQRPYHHHEQHPKLDWPLTLGSVQNDPCGPWGLSRSSAHVWNLTTEQLNLSKQQVQEQDNAKQTNISFGESSLQSAQDLATVTTEKHKNQLRIEISWKFSSTDGSANYPTVLITLKTERLLGARWHYISFES